MKYTVSKRVLRIECVIVCTVSHPNPECVFKAEPSDDMKGKRKKIAFANFVYRLMLFLRKFISKTFAVIPWN